MAKRQNKHNVVPGKFECKPGCQYYVYYTRKFAGIVDARDFDSAFNATFEAVFSEAMYIVDQVFIVEMPAQASYEEVHDYYTSKKWCYYASLILLKAELREKVFMSFDEFERHIAVQEILPVMNEVTKVESSVFDEVRYNAKLKAMMLVFKNGARYVYSHVSRKVHKELIGAESVGKYFNANIRGRDEYEPLKVA